MSYIPENHNHVSPYITVKQAEPLVKFLTSVFDGEEIIRFTDNDGRIMHVEVKIKDSIVMIGEVVDGKDPKISVLHAYVENVDEVYRKALEQGGTAVYEPQDSPDGNRRGMFKDPQQNEWGVSTKISE